MRPTGHSSSCNSKCQGGEGQVYDLTQLGQSRLSIRSGRAVFGAGGASSCMGRSASHASAISLFLSPGQGYCPSNCSVSGHGRLETGDVSPASSRSGRLTIVSVTTEVTASYCAVCSLSLCSVCSPKAFRSPRSIKRTGMAGAASQTVATRSQALFDIGGPKHF